MEPVHTSYIWNGTERRATMTRPSTTARPTTADAVRTPGHRDAVLGLARRW
jgi:hypothetical protein